MNVRHFFGELRRRKVVGTAIFYAAFAWAGIEGATTLGPVFGLSDAVVRIIVVVILIGFPVAVVLAWIFDLTPEGIREDTGGAGSAGSAGSPGSNGPGSTTTGPDPALAGEASAPAIRRPPPAPASPLIGRETELDEVASLFEGGARVVTVTGPGGTGKTRFSIEVLNRLGPGFAGGYGFVTVAGVEHAGDVLPFVALAFDAAEAEGTRPVEGLARLFGDREILLVLDNLEHVLDAAPGIAELLGSCPGLRLLATSRSPLKIGGEREFALSPLALPASDDTSFDDFTESPAIRLFVERAGQVRSGFRLTPDNADAVVAICRRLDGLPLALELAAARVRVLDPADLLDRLERALELLTSGARDAPERQRTLRGTIDWSHSLLDAAEQRLFRRLAVFVDGWTRDAAEAVCYDTGEAAAALDEMASLLEKGLVFRDDDGRFGMLQTILDFATERLEAAGEVDAVEARHARFFRGFADGLYYGLQGDDQLEWMRRGSREDGNLEATLAWFGRRAEEGDQEAVEEGLATCGCLVFYWHIRAQHVRMRTAVDAFLAARRTDEPTLGWLRGKTSASLASMSLGDLPRAIEEARAALEAAESLGDEFEMAQMPMYEGAYQLFAGNAAEADRLLGLSNDRSRAIGWDYGVAFTLGFHGLLAAAMGEPEVARGRLVEALAIQERLPDYEGIGLSKSGLAQVAMAAGDLEEALRLYEEARAAFETVGDRPEVARILDEMAWCTLAAGQTERARRIFLGSLQAHDSVGSTRGIGFALFGLAAAEVAEGRTGRGAVIFTAAEVFSEEEGVVLEYPWVAAGRDKVEAAVKALPEEELERATEAGQKLSLREAVAYAAEAAAVPVAG